MKRTDLIRFHTEEAADLRALADLADGPGSRNCLALARDHDAMAEAARVGDYSHPSEHIVGTDI